MAGGARCVRALVGGGVYRNAFMAAAGTRQAHSGAFPSSKAKSKGKSQPKKLHPLPSSQLGIYLGIPEVPRSETSVLLAKFIKLHTRENPGIKKDVLNEEKLKVVLEGKDKVGISEIIKLLNQKPGR